MGVLSPELNGLFASRLVTVWGVCVVFFQTTVVPTFMVKLFGLKIKLPLLSVVIMTVCVAPVTAVVAVGVALLPLPYLPLPVASFEDAVAVAVVPFVGDGLAAVPLAVLLPQAAKSTNMVHSTKQKAMNFGGLIVLIFLRSFFLS